MKSSSNSSGAPEQKWREDGLCGPWYPLSDGSPAECDPDSETPCCSYHGMCFEGTVPMDLCLCPDCIDYRLVKTIRESGENCAVAKFSSGFLKHACFDEKMNKQYFKCPFSGVNYTTEFYKGFSEICENDPQVYQACGFETDVNNTDVLCGGYICEEKDGRGEHSYIECSGDGCKAENRDCEASGDNVDTKLCNDKCDAGYSTKYNNCGDELAFCNGLRYGIKCFEIEYYRTDYYGVCDGQTDCDDGSDEQNCTVTESTLYSCEHYRPLRAETLTVPIHNYTRCGVIDVNNGHYPYCKNFFDQTNCTDLERVAGYCEVNGFNTSVSQYVVCLESDQRSNHAIELCEDDLQKKCLYPSEADCQVHKHRMCDGHVDCFDGGDENHDMCSDLIDIKDFKCKRRFRLDEGELGFPKAWLIDGVADCMKGEDEDEELWKLCEGEIRQIKQADGQCHDFFKCPGDEKFVPFDRLCDGVDSCGDGTENEVCKIARDFPYIIKNAPHNGTMRILCNAAVESCEVREFKRPWGDVFGEMKIELFVPTSKVECSNLFGEHYVFISCMDLCKEENLTCPLHGESKQLMYNSCPGQFPNRSYTLANNTFLTFLDKSASAGRYHQDFYQCSNSRCVDYHKVCDLINDCGDRSDESSCLNHMVCEDTLKNSSKPHVIAFAQKCDGIYDCFDLSDECNDSCMTYILNGWALKCFCWIMGILALLFNFFTVTHGLKSLKDCATEAMMTSKVLISIIGCGDFLIGLYLVILSTYDSIIYGESYCRNQAEWLTGTACLLLGVISTLGSQFSLFSMTVMSCIRIHGITSMRVSGHVNKKTVCKVSVLALTIIASSFAVALIPLMPFLEDYFVQGMYYDPAYKIFIGFPNKDKHAKVLDSYNTSENTTADLSWSDIGEKVDGMFSQYYGELARRPVHFYGNDGVCLFKYFVRANDARRSRQTESSGTMEEINNDPVVWTMLGVNLLCFIIISLCYIAITIKTRQSIQSSGQQDNPVRVKAAHAVQSKVMIIIATDFLCWVPFIVISGLHNRTYIDASSWYAPFAMIALPLNSVINPIIYDGDLKGFIGRKLGKVRGSFKSGATTALSQISWRPRQTSHEPQSIRIEPAAVSKNTDINCDDTNYDVH